MERFYGKDHSVGLSNEEAEECIRRWRDAALQQAVPVEAQALVDWFDERLHRRVLGGRAFRIAPAPQPIAGAKTLRLFGMALSAHTATFTEPDAEFAGRRLPRDERCRWLARLLDIRDFVSEALGEPVGFDPDVAEEDFVEVRLHRMWDRYMEAVRMREHLFIDDPRYPDAARLLDYLDQILELAETEGREARRAWPFPKILWEREDLLERLGRFDEMAQTMRRSASLEDESFRRKTEEYIAVVATN